MQFGILGPLDVRSATGEALPVGGPRPRALLVMLLLDAGRVVGLDRLVDGLYDTAPPAGAANAVQAHVSRLRRPLGAGLIEHHGGGYRLAVDPDDVDAHRFERLAREGHGLLAAGQVVPAAAVLREALGLWRGPALVDLPNARADAARLEELRLTATEDLMEAELALPDCDPVGELRRLVAAHPLRERLRGQLMRALHAAGRRAEALDEFEQARRLLADELGTDPSPDLAAVHLAVLRAAAPRRPVRQGLAAQVTSFRGRDEELARLDGLRAARLVTIMGAGGAGKTRLAIEAAGRRGGEVCFVDLSARTPDDDLPAAVLGALGVRDSGMAPGGEIDSVDPLARLVAVLNGGPELLLVLDNCEHVVDGAADLVRTLLARCRRLAVLATSREPLGLTGETLVPLASLGSPAPAAPPAEAVTHPAVRLFADRAAAVRPAFAVEADNVAAVVAICEALDGLPLAIELAAARLRQLPLTEIAARLADHGRFRLLARGDRTAASRHRTLRGVVEWSWDLLSPEEQVLARRVAVFRGGAPLAAVEAVCDVTDADERLADLVDKSFVEIDGDRYRMLETIRLFCTERVQQEGEGELLRRTHARYHLELARRADPHLRTAEQLDWLARLSAEHDNLMAALRWAVHGDRDTAFGLVAALAAYWWLSGRRGPAGAVAADLLDQVPDGPPDGFEEEYVSCVVHASPRAAPDHWVRAARIMGALDRPLRHPFGAALWGMAAGPWGPTEAAEAVLGTDPWNAALGRLSRELLRLLGGHPADAEQGLLDVLTSFRELGERWGTAQALDWLGLVASWRGEWTRAHRRWAQSLEAYEQLGAAEECVDVLCRRAESLLRHGDPAAAEADYRQAAELSTGAGRPETPGAVLAGLGELARLRGDARAAAMLLHDALRSTEGDPFRADARKARVLTALARLAAPDDPAEALRLHRKALTVARPSALVSDLADAAEGQADAALLAGDGERAALLLGAAVALRGTTVAGDPDVARTAAAARELLGPAGFAAAYARGAAMPQDRALTVLDEPSR